MLSLNGPGLVVQALTQPHQVGSAADQWLAPRNSLQVAYLSLFDQALDDTQVRWECGREVAAARTQLCLAGAQCGNRAGCPPPAC